MTETPETSQIKKSPKSLWDLYISFSVLSLQGFGGIQAVAQRELVDKKGWMTNEEYAQDWATAQLLPGPNAVIFAILTGTRYFGALGAFVGTMGMLSIPFLLMLCLTIIHSHIADHPIIVGALRGMGCVAAGMIAGSGLKLIVALKNHPLGWILCAIIGIAVFVCIAFLRLPLFWVIVAVGSLACTLTYRKSGNE